MAVTDDGLVERLAAIIRELDAHGDKDDAVAIRALLAAASDRDVLVGRIAKLEDEVVALWHQAPGEDRALHECLGMSLEEYAEWARTGDPVPLAGEL